MGMAHVFVATLFSLDFLRLYICIYIRGMGNFVISPFHSKLGPFVELQCLQKGKAGLHITVDEKTNSDSQELVCFTFPDETEIQNCTPISVESIFSVPFL